MSLVKTLIELCNGMIHCGKLHCTVSFNIPSDVHSSFILCHSDKVENLIGWRALSLRFNWGGYSYLSNHFKCLCLSYAVWFKSHSCKAPLAQSFCDLKQTRETLYWRESSNPAASITLWKS